MAAAALSCSGPSSCCASDLGRAEGGHAAAAGHALPENGARHALTNCLTKSDTHAFHAHFVFVFVCRMASLPPMCGWPLMTR